MLQYSVSAFYFEYFVNLDCSLYQISKLIMVGDSCFNTLSLDDSCHAVVLIPVAPQANPASPAILIFFAAFMSLS